MSNNFQKFQKRPLLISVCLCLLSCSIFAFFYIQIRNNNQDSEEAQVTWENESNRREELQSLDRLLKTVETERTALDMHFVKSSDVVPFLNMVETLAKDIGVKSEVILVDIPKDNSALNIKLTVSGSFGAIYKMVTMLEQSPYEVDFSAIEIDKSDTSDDKGKTASVWSGSIGIRLLSFVK